MSRLLSIGGSPDAKPGEADDWMPQEEARLASLLSSRAQASEGEEARVLAYLDRLDRLREDAFARATGERSPRDPDFMAQERDAARMIYAHAESGPEAYPQHWIAVRYATRALLHAPTMLLGSDPAWEQQRVRAVAAAEDWLRLADAAGPDAPVPDDARAAFRAWLTGLRHPDDRATLSHGGARLVFASTVATIRAWAGDPVRAARTPPAVHAALRFHLAEYSVWGLQYSQMLGHAPSAQDPLDPADPIVCLLNLASEHGMGWMFGDVGNCSFWIAPDALARRDFGEAWGTIEGH